MKKFTIYLTLLILAYGIAKGNDYIIKDSINLYYQKGIEFHDQGKYLLAEKEFIKAIKAGKQNKNTDHLAYSYYYVGRINSWKSDYKTAIANQLKARKCFLKTDNYIYWAITNIELGEQYYSIGNYDSSRFYYSLNILEKPRIPDKQLIIKSYQKTAEAYIKEKDYKNGYKVLLEATNYAERIEDSVMQPDLYLVIGNLFLQKEINLKTALNYFTTARDIYTSTRNIWEAQKANLYIGDAYLKMGADSLALANYKKGIFYNKSSQHWLISLSFHKIGMYYKSKLQYDSALVYFNKSIERMCHVCPEIMIHITLLEIADTYIQTGDHAQALKYLKKAQLIAEQSEAIFETIESNEKLGAFFISIDNPEKAEINLTKANKLAIKENLYEKIVSTAILLGNIYYSNQQYQKASDFYLLANTASDSLAIQEHMDERAILEIKFDIKNHEEELRLQKQTFHEQIARQKLFRNYFIIGSLSLVVFLLLLTLAYLNKKKTNRILVCQKREIEEMAQQIHEINIMRTKFFTNISHEIRTPLTLIKSTIEQVLKHSDSESQNLHKLKAALNSTNKLNVLFNQILDLQKLDESNHIQLGHDTFDIVYTCKELVIDFEGYCSQQQCTIEIRSNVSKALINSDKYRIESILGNVLLNAIKYNKTGGEVKFDINLTGSSLQFIVKDSGIGIPEDKLPLIGTRYFRVSQNATLEGFGLGLAYVKEVLQLMSGSFEIHSRVNAGTTVKISIPCQDRVIENENSFCYTLNPKPVFLNQTNLTYDEKKNDILIIEDNIELRSFINEAFYREFNVYLAKDGYEGKEMALQYIPDLIISDIMMPGLLGTQLCRELKENIYTCHIPILLLTAMGIKKNMEDGYECGADDYIVKPFDCDLLVKKVNNILKTREYLKKNISLLKEDQYADTYSDLDKTFLKNCISIINENISESNFTAEKLADALCMNSKTLTRKFKALTNNTPSGLIKSYRMAQAVKLLQKKYHVNEIAMMVGYEDSRRFSETFKKTYGKLPSQYIS